MKDNSAVTLNSKVYLNSTSYELKGVLFHSGTVEVGHVTAATKHDDSWYLCNDSIIKPITFEQVRQQGEGYRSSESAYICMYEQFN